MINGIIKLFYSEVVKVNIKKMTGPAKELEVDKLDPRVRILKDKMNVIDNILSVLLKLSICTVAILITFSMNFLFGCGCIIVMLLYVYYRGFINNQVSDIKNNLEESKNNIKQKLTVGIKAKINALIMILFIGLISNFNLYSLISFAIVLIFTIKDIYSNIVNEKDYQ